MRPRPGKPVEAEDGLADSIGARGVAWHAPGVRYVALGDSYTIGTSVAETDRWPDRLVAALAPDSIRLELVANLAVNGFTSRDVIEIELRRLASLRPEFVSLLVGVNDVLQGVPPETYRRNVGAILDDLVSRVGASRVLVVTTPDYTVTPAGADYGNPAEQADGIRENNRVLAAAAADRGIVVVDIHDISLRAKDDRSLVARDGLHPSGAQYALWVERLLPRVGRMLNRMLDDAS
jgi:lysophospholipase L1-like esterase